MDNNNGQFNFGSLLALMFIYLKLTGVIVWSWWWVLSPFWIGIPAVMILMGLNKLANKK